MPCSGVTSPPMTHLCRMDFCPHPSLQEGLVAIPDRVPNPFLQSSSWSWAACLQACPMLP